MAWERDDSACTPVADVLLDALPLPAHTNATTNVTFCENQPMGGAKRTDEAQQLVGVAHQPLLQAHDAHLLLRVLARHQRLLVVEQVEQLVACNGQ